MNSCLPEGALFAVVSVWACIMVLAVIGAFAFGWYVSKNRRSLVNDRIGSWLSAALEDPQVCEEMKKDIRAWFNVTFPQQSG